MLIIIIISHNTMLQVILTTIFHSVSFVSLQHCNRTTTFWEVTALFTAKFTTSSSVYTSADWRVLIAFYSVLIFSPLAISSLFWSHINDAAFDDIRVHRVSDRFCGGLARSCCGHRWPPRDGSEHLFWTTIAIIALRRWTKIQNVYNSPLFQ